MPDVPLSTFAEANPTVRTPAGMSGNDPVSFIPMSDVSESGHWTRKQTRPLRSVASGFTSFEDGDVLVAKITPCLENGKGAHALGLENGLGFGSTEFHVLRARQGHSARFVFHLTQWRKFRSDAEARMTGSAGQQRVPRSFFDEFLVADCDLREQAKIAEILDTCDAVIQKTEALIDNLKAIKQGLLHDLLTRGIDANGRLRPTQAEAPRLYKESPLGWIPREWSVVRVSEAGGVKLGRQRSPLHERGAYMRPYLRVANVFDGYIDYSDVMEMNFSPAEQQTFSLVPGDILLNEGQSLELVGRCAIYEGPPQTYCFQNTLVRFRAYEGISPIFARQVFKYWLDIGWFSQIAKQTTSVAHLGADRFAGMMFPAPCLEEQVRIGERISAVLHVIEMETVQLAKLKQEKSALMDDLLTGRVRVTPLLAKQPTERSA